MYIKTRFGHWSQVTGVAEDVVSIISVARVQQDAARAATGAALDPVTVGRDLQHRSVAHDSTEAMRSETVPNAALCRQSSVVCDRSVRDQALGLSRL